MIKSNKNFGTDSKKPYLIGIFIDFDNLEIGLSKFGLHFNYRIILNYLEGFGNLKVSIAYGDWKDYNKEAKQLSSCNVSIKQTVIRKNPHEKKNYTDHQMITDISEIFYRFTEIDLFVICSGDSHFLPIIHKIKKQSDKKIFIISEKYSLNRIYFRAPKIVDKVITYQELLKLFKI